MKNILRNGLLLTSFAMLAACGGQDVVKSDESGAYDPAGSNGLGSGNSGGAQVTTIDRSASWEVDPLNHPDSPLQNRVIYFAFDDSSLSEEGRQIVEAHAKFLAANPAENVVVEGHADERGTREYNIALGQQRADAVRRMMMLFGVTPAQVRVLSYGEEKPAALGHDERSWSLNRRVELRY